MARRTGEDDRPADYPENSVRKHKAHAAQQIRPEEVQCPV